MRHRRSRGRAGCRQKAAAAPAKQTSPATAPKPADKPKEAPKKRWGKKDEEPQKPWYESITAVRSSNPRGPRRGASLLLLYRRTELAAQIKGLPRHHHGRF